MAHAAFGGLGLGLFLFVGAQSDDARVQGVILLFCLLLAVAVGRATRRGGPSGGQQRLREDSAIGIAFAVAMALGALFIVLRQRREPQYTPSWEGYLFGSLTTIGQGQVWLLAVLAVAVLTILFFFHKELTFYSYDETLAEVSGLPVGFLHYLLVILLVLTVVLAARIVGIVLVSSSLVLPGVFALALCRRLGPALVLAGASGVASYEAGLYLSYVWNVPPGSAVILVQFLLVLVGLAAQRVAR
jgi:zinc transport system permease protein